MQRYAVIIAGPSGVGKTTVADALIERLGNLEMSRSATTRAKRGDGRDDEYIYLTVDEFKSAIAAGDMAEHAEYGGNLYGTRKSELARIHKEGKQPILVLEYNGVKSLKESLDYPVLAFYVYESLDAIEARLRLRDAGKEEAIARRCAENAKDYSIMSTLADRFDAFVENRDLDTCIETISSMIPAILSGNNPTSASERMEIALRLVGDAAKH